MNFKKICYNCMKEKNTEGGACPHCGFVNEDYHCPAYQLPPMTPLNGKYLLGKAIGAGGFGITYLALDTHLQVVVAIKELYLKKISARDHTKVISVNASDKNCFEENKKRFLQEARVLAMFNEKDNEGVVIVKDHFEENNTAYIVMEYLEGETLKKYIGKKKIPFETVKTLMEPVCHALTKIHQFGVVHLDVSPDNIMILPDKGVKLLDFGGAKLIGAKEANDVIAFKRGYAPPEQYMENGRIGQWTDVYATAATMYYCLTGVKPVDSMERRAGAELELPSKLGANISSRAEAVLMKAMALEPDKRFQTMEDFWNALNIKKKNYKVKFAAAAGGVVAAGVVVLIAISILGGGKNEKSASLSGNTVQADVTAEAGKEDTTTETSVEAAEGTQTSEEVLTVGETMPIDLGTYIFENAKNREFVFGVDSNFGDDGAQLVLKDYSDVNCNRLFVTDEIEDDGFYNLRAAHTDSYIETSESQEIGEPLRQFAEMFDAGTEKWSFVYCGYDEEKEMNEVIIKNAAGSVLAPQNGTIEAGTPIVLTEYNQEDDSQKWYMRWSEKDTTEADVKVYHEGDLVEDISGIYNVASALDGMTSMDISRDTAFHPEPTVVTFKSEWLTTEDTGFQFEFVPTGSESRYKIFPADQAEGEHKCLEYNPDTLELVMRDESDSQNQLFRIVYVKSNTYLIQAYNEDVAGFDLDADGTAVGKAILVRPYDAVSDSRLVTWLLQTPHEPEA